MMRAILWTGMSLQYQGYRPVEDLGQQTSAAHDTLESLFKEMAHNDQA